MAKTIYTIVFLLSIFFAAAQTPQKFNYQAVARDAQGAILPNQNIKIRASILDSSVAGPTQYSETHNATTSQLGLFNVIIGSGTVAAGSFASIPWANSDKYLKIEMDVNGGNNFTLVGTSQLLSVPYALYSERTNLSSGNGIAINNNVITNTGDNDNNPSNELQTLEINGNLLSLTNGGNTVSLPSSSVAIQQGNGINVNQNGNVYTISNSGDLSTNNELQTLGLTGNILSISNGNTVTLPSSGNSNPVAPSYTTTQILNLQNPLVGTIVFNSDDNALYYYSGTNWYKVNATILANPESYVVTDCLVAYYNFDDNSTADVHGMFEGNNSGCVFDTDVNSHINYGKSAVFDGTDRITVPMNPLENLTQGSISFWYKGTAGGCILQGATTNNGSAFKVFTFSNQGNTYLTYNAGVPFSVAINMTGLWQHFVITISPTQRKFYVDGVLQETISNNGGMTGTNFSNGMLIGVREGVGNSSLVGKLDNLRIHCKALTQDEVDLIYNNGQ